MTRRQVVWLLGGLWILDGVLQLQPGMFTMAMIQAVMQPTVLGQPGWVQALLRGVIDVLSWNLTVTNLAIAAVQLAAGLGLILAGPRRTWPYWLSLIWSVLLWPSGQGFGGLFTGQVSLLTGAPGSAVLYGLLTAAAWPGAGQATRRRWVGIGLGALWALGAALQAGPGFFAAAGLSGLLTGMAGGQPVWLSNFMTWTAAGLGAAPALANAASVALMAAVAAGIWVGGPYRRPALVVSIVLTVWAWVVGQGFGMLFTGMATDPNSSPLYVALAAYVWNWRGGREAASAEAAV